MREIGMSFGAALRESRDRQLRRHRGEGAAGVTGRALRGLLALLLILAGTNAARAEEPNDTRAPSASAGGAGKEKPEGEQPRDLQTELRQRPDEERPEEQFTLRLFNRPLTVGGEYESRLEAEADPWLGERSEDDEASLRQSLQVELLYALNETVSLFGEGGYAYDWRFYRDDGNRQTGGELRRGEMFLDAANLGLSGLSLRAGRQRFRDRREWWWDQNLDAVRLSYQRGTFRADLGLAQELARVSTDEDFIDPEQDDVLRVLGSAQWRYARRHRLALVFLHQRDHSTTQRVGNVIEADREDESDADLSWLGVRAMGRWRIRKVGRVYYWADAALVRGEEDRIDFDPLVPGFQVADSVVSPEIRGWAFDAGLTWRTRLRGDPTFTLGYAFGSGEGDPSGSTDRSYRQSGLQRNDGKFRGVDSFRYYGELFDPELSNLHIGTVAFGMRFLESSSIELLYHHYRQAHRADFLRDTGIRAQPRGRDRSIGHEIDAVLGLEEWERVRIEIIGAVFRAGDAYDDLRGELAYGATAKFEFVF